MDLNSASTVVLQVLTQATSQDTAVLKPAEEQLKQWETQPGFYSVLLNIFTNHTLDINVRWLAVLYFKNGIDRYWRRVAPHALSEEEKTTLRAGLITNFNEPINQIATQIAVLIAKVARLDCPRQWPELIPTLIESVKVQDDLRQHRALLTFYHVTKTLASKRLAADRKLFYDLASGIYNFACSLWNHHTDTFLQQVSSGNEAAVLSSLERTLLSLKVLRKLTVNGFVEPHKNMEVMGFLHGIFDRLKQFLECSRSIGTDNVCRDRLEKTIILFTKVLLDFLDQHPFSFTPLIQRSLEFSVSYVFTEVGEGVTFERFIVQCMNLIKMIVKNYAYKPSKNFEDSSPETLEAHKIKMAFFTYPTLTEICRRLVSHYFLLTEEELTMWEEDPEGFNFGNYYFWRALFVIFLIVAVEETGGDSWKYSLRPCTEVLFIDIFHEYNQTLTPVLLEMMQTLQGPTNVEDMNALLIKDAVYNAVGLAAYELFDSVDFDQWFKNQLLPELQVIHNRYKPLRRRVIWLVGQWISVKFKSDLRPMLYEAICNLLQDQDLVVRIETATTLKLTVDDFEFRTDQFLPYLETMFTLLFQLLQQVTECDTKMHVLHVLSCVIERVNMQIRPYVGCLVQYLPLLWKQSEEHNMLRCAILTTLIHLVQGLGADSKNLYPFLLPVIQLSTDVSQPPHVYLLEDGLELWLVTLENSPCVTPELLRIFQNMSPLLELSSENLRTCFKIINGYIFLSSTEFLQTYAVGLCQSFCDLLKEITTEGQVQVLKVVENALKVNPVLGAQMFQPILPCVFRGIIEGERYPVVMSTYLGVMGRVLLQNTSFFSSLLTEMAHKFNQEMDQLLGNMIEMWVDRMDNITQPERRKLSALALLSLLPSDNSVIQDKFCGIINISVEGLHDVMTEDPETGTYKDCMLMSHLEEPKVTEDEEPPTEQDKRKKMLALKDPVHTVSLQQFIYEKLKAQQELLGEQGFQSLMETVDTEIVTQLQEFLHGF
ncbi:importin-11 isoform X1 [Pteropus medius]|uniref:Importin-11 n=1 Tax=Pteropus vampyrus TaxID=132908 RepID=A0A6P3R5D8_PTEVA|nr:importin-11 isoform X1 [Pteropus vampyrus]XP_011375651.1 importin-11 isoform X1 [Pteropus vampyrus]XP_011375652.1 importin-11 isoform X1 [Pteropus vampyrus]XP_039725941.1 importin-11 isoform X1 [Pteropus giganteus]XP_039725942.1 importin-11 isoform X1 [Pteropus giganteus]XP_039725943.1 importin-11 isoform X1 [Pteropus giganteus]